jgi:DNA-binding GntR family transcriptional regulator
LSRPADPFPAEQLRQYARGMLADGQPDVYARYRALCDAVLLTESPALPQNKLARRLGLSRTTLRSMLRRLGLSRADGRKAVPS